jgi:type I restriction enzyme S subunit
MKHWPTRSLGELVLPIEQRDPRQKPAEEFSYVDIAGVDNQAKIIVATKRIAGADAPSRARKVIREGDILVSTVRPNLNAVAVVPAELDNQICSTGFSVLRPSNKLLSRYIFAFCRSPFFIESLVARTTGANYPAVNDGEVKDVEIPVPPLEQQQRIVDMLDEADVLRNLRGDADRRTAALIPELFHDIFGKETIESSKALGDVCHKITDGVHITPTYVASGVAFLRVTDIQGDEIDWSIVKRIPETEYQQITRRVRAELGDVLYSKNGTIGIAKEITWNLPFAHFVSLALLKPNRAVLNPTFLTTWLNTPDALRQAVGHSKKGTVTNLHLTEIRKMRIPCPLMEKQEAFVRQVRAIRELEANQTSSRIHLDALFQSMMHRAFTGES